MQAVETEHIGSGGAPVFLELDAIGSRKSAVELGEEMAKVGWQFADRLLKGRDSLFAGYAELLGFDQSDLCHWARNPS